MGACCSLFCPNRTREDIRLDQYLNLVASKPSPVTLEQIDLSGSDTDVPLFAQVCDDSDEPELPAVEGGSESDSAEAVVSKKGK